MTEYEFMVSFRETMRLWFQDYSEARVISKVMFEDTNAKAEVSDTDARARAGISCPGISARIKILCSLWFPETLALRKELGSGSDVTGSARHVGNSLWKGLALVALWKDLGSGSDMTGECKMVDQVMANARTSLQDYSEAIVVSMLILEFQATGPRLVSVM
ncbi:Neurogenic Locus Notch Protein 3 [Manis pentadactyla]|nr:Neurogenic Locus Notch Protein 3 [Manis pentadactyla]